MTAKTWDDEPGPYRFLAPNRHSSIEVWFSYGRWIARMYSRQFVTYLYDCRPEYRIR